MLKDAISFAIEAHKNQWRRYDHTPYIRHPLSVMGMLTEFTMDEHALAAAVLHDTVEDCEDITLEVIHERFGEVVAGYVFYVTKQSRRHIDGVREIRDAIDREHYSHGSEVSQVIKIMDMLDNIPGIWYNDPTRGLEYIKEKRLLLRVLVKAPTSLRIKAHNLMNNLINKT
jgi:(p)ppGpp synthase/HD superfamily hydrolase